MSLFSMIRADLVVLGNGFLFCSFSDISVVEYKLTTDANRSVKEMHDTTLDGRTILVRHVSDNEFGLTFCRILSLASLVTLAATLRRVIIPIIMTQGEVVAVEDISSPTAIAIHLLTGLIAAGTIGA